eukprot:TRINITY_DN102248_c0_g1_i1.p1 TRINITY_DN102248_c0_g1~~TRINITY_DN102248_c0_g1_i1.p1  ORF type:complete len:555 (-),score=66.01 TRINITY_DN102248_c0_g1_i1:37-1701(-)
MNLTLKCYIFAGLASVSIPAAEEVCAGWSLLQLAGGNARSSVVVRTPTSAANPEGRPGSNGTDAAGTHVANAVLATASAASSEGSKGPRSGSTGTDAAVAQVANVANAAAPAASSEASKEPRPGSNAAGPRASADAASAASWLVTSACESISCVNTTSLQLEVRVTFIAFLSMHGFGYFATSSQGAVATVGNQPDYDAMHMSALEPFRFLGVLHIVLQNNLISGLHDVGLYWTSFAGWGKYWIQLFFVLSGFVLYVSQKGNVDIADKKTFFRRRFYSTYPGYLVGCLLGLLAAQHPFQTAWEYASVGYVPGLLLMDSWFPPFGTTSPDGPGWLLCTMAAFYFFFPSWYRFVRASQVPKLLACIAFSCGFSLPLICAIRGDVDADFAWRHPLANWHKFFFGVCLGRLLPEFKKAPAFLQKFGVSLTLSVVLLAFTVVQPPPLQMQVWDLLLDGPVLLPLLSIILIFVPIGEDVILSSRVLQSETLLWLGSISAQLYILHAPVQQIMNRIFQSPSLKITLAAQLVVAAAVSSVFKYMSLTKGRSRVLEWIAETYGP